MTFGVLDSERGTPMRLVVADTSPLNYLILIGQIEILPALFEKVFVPQIVRNELQHEAPESVRRWIAMPPSWLEIVPEKHESDEPDLLLLDDGERAAILLAIRIGAELRLIDDRNGVEIARSRGFAVTGTLGILDLAASRGLIRLSEAVERLKNTSFRYPRKCWRPCWLGIHRKDSREAMAAGADKGARGYLRQAYRGKSYVGAPRSMKMGTSVSP